MRTSVRWFVTLVCVSLVASSGLSQVSLEKSDRNPMLRYWSGDADDPSGYKYALEPTVLYDSLNQGYQMWFTSFTFNTSRFSISAAVSPNGTDWYLYGKNPVLRAGVQGSFDAEGSSAPKIIKTAGQYFLYYTGVNAGKYQIGGAVSPDGRTWEKFGNNPVLTPGGVNEWDSRIVGWCEVLQKDGIFYMWYNGAAGNHWEGIGLATSFDGIHWTKYADNPVFVKSASGWDSYEVATPTVVVVNNMFYMFYQGYPAPGPTWFGWAYSQDGIVWTRGATHSVLTPGTGWDATLGTADVVYRDHRFHLWYSGRSSATGYWQIGYASADLTALTGITASASIPERASLYQSYPNPFNPTTTIEFSLPTASSVDVRVFNALGQEMATLYSGDCSPGTHRMTWDAAGFPSGTYYYRLRTGSFVAAKAAVFLK
jgi:beta-1,2-mannobiose phosphorylase / 1,2-beta-oligomannan phosphorylase